MKLNELYQYIKSGRFRSDMILKFKNIHEIDITRIEDISVFHDRLGNKDLIRLFFDEKAEIDKTDIFRIVCHTVEREILQIIENGKSLAIFNNCYYVFLIYRDDEGKLRSAQIEEVPGVLEN